MTIDPRADPSLTLEMFDRVEAICTVFEKQLRSGKQPLIEEQLGDSVGLERSVLLRELLALELEAHMLTGQRPLLAQYAKRFPADGALVDLTFHEAAEAAHRHQRQLDAKIQGTHHDPFVVALPCMFGDYELLKEIARGGMGVVYKAQQVSLNRIVAVKMLLTGRLASTLEIDRFNVEVQAAAQLDHPNIVPIIEVGQIDGQRYFSMGYVDGRSVADRIAAGPLPPREAANLLRAVAEAVHYAHGRGVFHRDLKPANILLDGDHHPHITDFGLAKRADDRSGLTTTGDVIGTPSYMPPEQALGKTNVIGPASDVYSLGAVLYATLTGRPPFQAASTLDTLKQLLEQEPIEPRRLDPTIPRDLETVCLKCLEKDAKRRYATPLELAEDLERFLTDRPIQARRTNQFEHAWRLARRNPWTAGLTAAVVLLTLSFAVVSTASGIWLQSALAESEMNRHQTEQANADAKAELWASYLGQARAIRSSRRPGQRVDGLRVIREALRLGVPAGRSLAELRTEAIACLLLPDIEVWKEWNDRPDRPRGFAIDEAFERYARGDKDGNVSVRSVVDDKELYSLPGSGLMHDWCLDFSSDGKLLSHLCLSREGYLARIWSLDGPQSVLLYEDNAALLLRPDGRQFAAAKTDGSIRLFDTATGEELRRYQVGATAISWAWNPKLAKIAVLTPQRCFVLDLETAETSPVPIPGAGPNMAWHPNGQILAVVADRRIHLWDTAEGGLMMPPLVGHKTDGVRVKFNHSGDQLLSLDWTALWRLWDAQTGVQLLAMPANGDILSFSRDDRLAGADTTSPHIRLFRIHSGREFRSLVHYNNGQPTAYDADSALHADGQLLAIRVPEGIALIDLTRHAEVDVVPIPRNRPFRFDLKANELWTNGSKGLVSWPLQTAPDTGAVRLGPPRLLSSFNHEVTFGASADGETIAIPNLERGALLWQRADNRMLPLEPQEDVRTCAVSPDGHWVATGSHDALHGAGGKIWDAATGAHIADLPVGPYGSVRFSPDSHWLVTTSGGMRLWKVGTWTEGPRLQTTALDCGFAFSSESKIMAIGDGKGVVRLLVTETGNELARLTSPEPTRLIPLHFSPDGTNLVTVGAESSALHIIDLRVIREQLVELGLDWDQPSYPPAKLANSAPLRVEVILDGLP